MSDAGLNIPVTFDVDEGATRAASAQAGRQLAAGMAGAANNVDDEFKRFYANLQRENKNAVRQVAAGFRQIEAAGKGASVAVGSSLQANFARAGKELNDITADAKALAATIEAQKNRKFGIVDEKEFALLNRSLEKLQAFQKQARTTDFGNPTAVRKLRTEFTALAAEATKAKGLFQTSTKDQIAAAQIAARRINQVEAQAGRERNIEAAKLASQAKFQAQREQQEILSSTQRANAQRVQITRFALETIGRLEKGLGATVSGIARTATRSLGRGYQDTLGRISASFSRNSSRIESIERSSASRRISIFRSAQSSQERILSQSVTRQTQIIQAASAKANAGIVGAARRSPGLGSLGGGLAGFGVLSLGLERFSSLERLTKQFTALTGSADQAALVLQQVKDFARATPFDLVGVADLAKGFLAIKTPIDQVLPRVRAIADAVALTGGGVDELNRIQRAIGQVVSAGRLQGDELNQLAENLPGLNIRQILADQLTGGNVQELIKLQEAGEISGDAFVDGLITGLANDTRLQGASEDLAKTLGGRLANLKEVVADVGASFIGLIAEPMKKAAELATVALDGLSQFIKGNISPAMQVLRTAIGGAAAAIGTLLIAKVAGEALQVLATSARLLLTPMGIIVTAVGLAGAAFAVMRDRSEEFRDVTDRLGRLLGTTFGRVLDSVGEAIEKIRDAFTSAKAPIDGTADAIERTLAPARTFISEIGLKLGDAIATAGRFLTDTLIPAVADFIIFVGQRAGPAIREFVEDLRRVIEAVREFAAPHVATALEKLQTGLEFVRDIGAEVFDTLTEAARGAASGMQIALSPIARIVEGFKNLRKNLGPELLGIGAATVTGGLIAGPIGALVAGVGTAVATLSPTIRKAIVDGVTKARDNVVKIFRGIDWPGLAGGVLKFVERAGNILGQLVSDRRFLLALAGIAAAAGAVAFKFVLGFVKGVISNLGDIKSVGLDIGNALLDGITDFVTDHPLNAALILGGALLAKTARGIGKDMAAGLTSGFGGFRSNAAAGGDFFSATLFGAGGPNAFVKQAAKTAQRAADEVRRQLSTVSRASGGGGVLALGGVNQEDISRARGQFKTLTDEVGKGAAAGLRLRTAFADTFSAIRTNSGGIRGIFQSLTTGAGDAAAALKGQGAAIGSALGTGVVAGFGSAVAGQQLGSGNVAGGLGGILAASIGAGLIAGPVVGVAVAGVGLLTAAFTANGKAAREAREQIAFYRDILVDIAGSGEDAAAAIRAGFGEQLRKELPATIAALAGAGITTQDLLDIVSLAPAQFDKFAEALPALKDFGQFGDLAKGSAESLQAVSDVLNRLPKGAARDVIQGLVDDLVSGKISADEYAAALDFISDETAEFVAGQGSAADILKITGDAAKSAATSLELGATAASNLFEARLAGTNFATAVPTAKDLVQDLADKLQVAKDRVDELLNPGAGTLAEELAGAIGGLEGIAGTLGGGLQLGGILGGAQVQSGLSNFKATLADVVKEGIEDGASEAEIDDNLRVINAAISELDVPEDVKALMRTEVENAINADVVPVTVTAEVDTGEAEQAGRDLGAAAKRGADDASLTGIGENVGDGFAEGIRNRLGAVQAAAAALASAAENVVRKRTGAQSPAKVYIGIGGDVVDGFTLGIINNLGFVEAAGTQMGNTFADATVEAVAQLNDKIAGLRLDLFGDLLSGSSGPDSALRSGQSSIRSLTEALAGPIREAAEAGAEATRSIDLGAGLDNREAFADVVEQIKGVGKGLLEAGFSPAQVASELNKLRTQALDVAGFLGFDTAAIDDFFTSLGLSAGSLENFAQQLLTETERLKKEAEKEEADKQKEEADKAAADAKAAEEEKQATIENLVVNLALPFADPEAVALAVANRTVSAVRTRA